MIRRILHFIIIILSIILISATPVYASGYSSPTPGENPHGNYSDAGDKCKVCHAVHNAASGSQTLLRSTRNDACTYCHITGSYSLKAPYGTSLSNYTTEYNWNHDDNHDGHNANEGTTCTDCHNVPFIPDPPYEGCISCHSVHGANTINSGSKILKNDPGKAIAEPVTNEIDFCRDCHNKSGGNLQAGGCYYTCHQNDDGIASISPEYYLDSRNGVTHIMTTTLTGNYGTKVAWIASETCRKCHQAGQPYASSNSFPHYTPSATQFLDYDYTQQNTNLDLVCMNCHTDTGDGDSYTSGVGKTF